MGVGRERENLSLYISLERERKRSRENTLRARVHAHARGTGKRRDKRHGRDARHETRVTRGGKIIKKSPKKVRKMHIKSTVDNY